MIQLHEMTQHYLECALWSSTNDDGEPLEEAICDLPEKILIEAEKDCQQFLANYADDIDGHYKQAGHDFWLTRNHHGAGFWDGDWSKEVGERLTKAAHQFSQRTFYHGDDGLLYLG